MKQTQYKTKWINHTSAWRSSFNWLSRKPIHQKKKKKGYQRGMPGHCSNIPHLHNKRSVPARLLPASLPALSSSSGRGRTRVSGHPACSAASCVSLWTSDFGTKPLGRSKTSSNEWHEQESGADMPQEKKPSCWHHCNAFWVPQWKCNISITWRLKWQL